MLLFPEMTGTQRPFCVSLKAGRALIGEGLVQGCVNDLSLEFSLVINFLLTVRELKVSSGFDNGIKWLAEKI